MRQKQLQTQTPKDDIFDYNDSSESFYNFFQATELVYDSIHRVICTPSEEFETLPERQGLGWQSTDWKNVWISIPNIQGKSAMHRQFASFWQRKEKPSTDIFTIAKNWFSYSEKVNNRKISDVFRLWWESDQEKTDQILCWADTRLHWENKFSQWSSAIKPVLLVGNSTDSVFPPRTNLQRFLVFGETADDVASKLKEGMYEQALNRLDELTDSIRTTILHGEYSDEMRTNLDIILDSLEAGKRILYHGIREEKPLETVKESNMIDILNGYGSMMRAYSNFKDSTERMTKKWEKSETQ